MSIYPLLERQWASGKRKRERVRPLRKKILGLAFALILALTTFATSAFAHECFIAVRSDQGNIAAAHSANWYNFGSLTEVFTIINVLITPDGAPLAQALTPKQVAWAVNVAKSQGLPNELTVFTKKVLLAGTPLDGSAKMTDGKGIDHLFDYSPNLVEIYFAALQQPAT